jgi:hypothetical protein
MSATQPAPTPTPISAAPTITPDPLTASTDQKHKPPPVCDGKEQPLKMHSPPPPVARVKQEDLEERLRFALLDNADLRDRVSTLHDNLEALYQYHNEFVLKFNKLVKCVYKLSQSQHNDDDDDKWMHHPNNKKQYKNGCGCCLHDRY